MTHWSYMNHVFARIEDSKDISLAGGRCVGCFRIRLELSPRMLPSPPIGPIEVVHAAARISSEQGEVALLGMEERVALQTTSTEVQRSLRLAADLDLRRLLALDALRGDDGSLQLNVLVWGIAVGISGPKEFFGQHLVMVSQADWLQLLKDCEYGETALIEVIAAGHTATASEATVVKSLQRAQARLRQAGEATRAVGDLRLAIDKVKERFGFPHLAELTSEERKKLKSVLEGLSLDQRLALLKFAVRHLTHPPHHDDEQVFSTAQARLVMQATAACLAYELGHVDAG